MAIINRFPLGEESLDQVGGGEGSPRNRLYYVDELGGEADLAGPFHTREEAQAALEKLQRMKPDKTYIITYTNV